VRKRSKGGGITFGRKRRRAVRKDREPDEDDSQFALTRFVPLLQEVLEDAGAGWEGGELVLFCCVVYCCVVYCGGVRVGWYGGAEVSDWGLRHGRMLCNVRVCEPLPRARSLSLPLIYLPPAIPCAPFRPAAAGKLSTDEYPFVAAPASPSSNRASLPSSADNTPRAGVSVRSVRTTGGWAKKGAGGTPDKAESTKVGIGCCRGACGCLCVLR
jgi:hypothetical protein